MCIPNLEEANQNLRIQPTTPYSPPVDAIEPVYPLEELLIPGGKVVGTSIKAGVTALTRPKVTNEIVTTGSKALRDRLPNDPSEITHAYRNMGKAEVDDIIKTGYAKANPKNKYAEGKKWWSGGDEKGHFGRNWKSGEDAVTVRTLKQKVPPQRAVSAKDLEAFNKLTGKFEPLIKK